MDEEFSSALLTGCVLLASCGLYPARPAERFARRMPISLPQEASLAAHRLPPTNDPHVHPPILVGHAVELATAQPPPDDDGQVQPTPRPAQQRLHQLRAPGADSGRPPAGHGRSGRPRRPRPSQPYGCLPTPHSRTSLRPDTADAATHKYRTPTPDAGQRTPGAQTPAPDTGHRSRGQANVDTGHSHRTPDTGHWPRTRTE
jgi:hypothetical protein